MNHELYRLVGLKIRFIKIKELYVKIYLCSLLFHRCYNREGYHDVDHDSVDNSFDFDYNCDYYNSFFISFCFDDLKIFYLIFGNFYLIYMRFYFRTGKLSN